MKLLEDKKGYKYLILRNRKFKLILINPIILNFHYSKEKAIELAYATSARLIRDFHIKLNTKKEQLFLSEFFNKHGFRVVTYINSHGKVKITAKYFDIDEITSWEKRFYGLIISVKKEDAPKFIELLGILGKDYGYCSPYYGKLGSFQFVVK